MAIDRQEQQEYLTVKVRQYTDMVLRLALIHLGNRPDAQDVCQEVFIKLFRHERSFADAEHEKAWIIRVTINACRDARRSSWKKRFLLFAEIPFFEVREESAGILSEVLALPRKYRVVIHLHYYEGYRTAEIAELLGLNDNTVRTQLKRARELLKKKITGGFDDDET